MAMARGSFNIGTGGVGFVAVNPYVPFQDIFLGYATVSSYTPNQYQAFDGSTGQQLAFYNDCQYNSTSISNYLEYRLVGCGLKISYAGSVLNEQGSLTLVRNPGSVPIIAPQGQNQLLSIRDNAFTVVKKDISRAITYLPLTAADMAYRNVLTYPGNGGTGNTNCTLLAYVSGGTPGAAMNFEVVQFFEFVGQQVQSTTKSHNDPLGFASIISSVSEAVTVASPQKAEKQLLQRAEGELTGQSGFGALAESLLPLAVKAVGSLI